MLTEQLGRVVIKMKQPKKLTREQKEICSAHGLNPENYMLVEEMMFYIKVIEKNASKILYLDKFIKKSGGNRCILREDLIQQ